MTFKSLFIATAAILTTGSALPVMTSTAIAGGHIQEASAELKNLDGATIGTATLQQSPAGVLVHVRVENMPTGKKGIHLHSKAHCTADSGFKSSKGHHAEAKGDHGLMNPAGPGNGDLGNIFVGADGVGEMEFFKAGITLDGGAFPLLDEDGSAIVIHANADDHISQPIGGAGARLVCGVLTDGIQKYDS